MCSYGKPKVCLRFSRMFCVSTRVSKAWWWDAHPDTSSLMLFLYGKCRRTCNTFRFPNALAVWWQFSTVPEHWSLYIFIYGIYCIRMFPCSLGWVMMQLWFKNMSVNAKTIHGNFPTIDGITSFFYSPNHLTVWWLTKIGLEIPEPCSTHPNPSIVGSNDYKNPTQSSNMGK